MTVVTGSATDLNDLLAQFQTFVNTAGWTTDRFDARGSGKALSIHKSGAFFTLRSLFNETFPPGFATAGYGLMLSGATGFNSADDWYKQPGACGNSGDPNSPMLTGFSVAGAGAIGQFWFVCDAAGDNVFLLVLRGAGVVGHLGFGVSLANLAGASGSWPWFTGTRGRSWVNTDGNEGYDAGITTSSYCPGTQGFNDHPLCFVYGTVDTYTGWISFTDNQNSNTTLRVGVSASANEISGTSAPMQSVPNYSACFQYRSPKALNSGLVLLPVMWYVPRDVGGYSLIGELPVVAATFAPTVTLGSSLTIGSDTYLVFRSFALHT